MRGAKRRVLIADDEARILRALKDLLTANGYDVITAENGTIALEIFDSQPEGVDLALLDVMMPGLDGFTVLKELRSRSPQTPVIMLTARGDEADQLQGFSKGADDYISKPFSTSLLLARMEAVLKRSGKGIGSFLSAGGITLFPDRMIVEVDKQPVELTRREFTLLQYFMKNQGILLSRNRLLDNVWGYDYEGDERTVDTHVKNLRLKLGSKAEYIHTMYRMGYKFEVTP